MEFADARQVETAHSQKWLCHQQGIYSRGDGGSAAMIYAAGETAAGNPFAVLTAVVAPAILTNACSLGAAQDRGRGGRGKNR